MNSEVRESLQREHIVEAIKTQSLRLYGHMKRMREEK